MTQTTDATSSSTPTPIEQIYHQLMGLFGGTNPNQFLNMSLPGTVLTQSDFAWDVTTSKPALVAEAESRLVDQMYDVAQISGASNGQTLSSQYTQALSALVPRFEPGVAAMKNKLREFLTSAAPPASTVNGTPFTGTLQELYFALYESWLEKKSEWDTLVVQQRSGLSSEEFLKWYEEVAEGHLARIDAAEGRLLAVLSPSDMDAILGALAAGPGGQMQESLDQVLDLRLPSPSGGYVYPVDLTPTDWFLGLASDLDPVDLLGDPQFIALTLSGRTQAVMASISQVQALLAQVPSSDAAARAAAAFTTAQTTFTSAQNSLMNTYTSNTVTAVQMVMSAVGGGEIAAGAKGLEELDSAVTSVSTANKDEAVETAAARADGSPLTPEDFDKLVAGQQAAIAAQSALTSSAQALSDAGMNLASTQARQFGNLPVLLARLQSQLADVQTLQSQLAASVSSGSTTRAVVPVTYADADKPAIASVAALLTPTDQPSPIAWLTSVWAAITPTTTGATPPAELLPLYRGALRAWAQPSADAVRAAAANLAGLVNAAEDAFRTATSTPSPALEDVLDALKNVVNAPAVPSDLQAASASLLMSDQADVSSAETAFPASAAALRTLIQAATAAVDTGLNDVNSPVAPTATDDTPVVAEVKKISPLPSEAFSYLVAQGTTPQAASSTFATMTRAVQGVLAGYTSGAPASTKAAADDRWMQVQMSFSQSEMQKQSSEASLASTSSWSCDFFFGSAGSSSSSSSSSVSDHSFEEGSTIAIGFNATKVNVNRGWFDPGVFKLSSDMSRLTTAPVSVGAVEFDGASAKQTLEAANAALLPCFPVAFLVVKDVTLRFSVHESQLDAVQSVVDSRSASGGGFFCFSSASSSSSHSDSSSMSSVSSDNAISVTIPGPQILGWFLEFTPKDDSTRLMDEVPAAGQELDITQFVEELRRYQDPDVPAAVTDGGPSGRHASE
ncbi:hypothetical protein [Nocardioides plantarum]|uniref:Uncharacterized protein n=1 Tax=Nocardioides plantarum TaxID=29299 RepID=A0ABV5KF50_9ACTN|nr:hypothetical protein [Nocardioides plantarum]